MDIKKISFILAGFALIILITIIFKFNAATAAKQNGKKFGDWVVSCTKHKKKQTCLLTQEIYVQLEEPGSKQKKNKNKNKN